MAGRGVPVGVDADAATAGRMPDDGAMNRAMVGGLAWASIAHYFVVEEVVRRGWSLPYSRRTNVISDLGAVTCGTYEGREICSPDHVWINVSFALVGVAAGVGAVLVRTVAPDLITRPALALYAAGGVGSVLVGLFPEDTTGPLHALGAGMFFVGANLGHVLLGSRLRGQPRPAARPYGTALAVVGAVGLVGSALVATGADLGLGIGLVERVVVYGADLGFIATGLALLVPRRSAASAT